MLSDSQERLLQGVARELREPVVIRVGEEDGEVTVRVSAGPHLSAVGARGFGVGEVVDFFLAGVISEAVRTTRGAS